MINLIHLPISQIRYNNSEVVLMRLDRVNIYDTHTNCIEYTVDNYDSSLHYFNSSSLLNSKDPYEYYCAGLPRIYSDVSTYTYDGYDMINIIKNDGTSTEDTATKIHEVSKVILTYPETTHSIKFYGGYSTATKGNCNPMIQNVLYCNTSKVTDMSYMFYNCTGLRYVNTNNWDTSKVTDMSYMFYNCIYLASLDVNHWNTCNVTTMRSMFNGCQSLRELNLSKLNTSNVTDMRSMFCNCIDLTSLDLSNFNINNVTNITSMFDNCNNLTSLDTSNWNTGKVVNMCRVFRECNGLTSLDISHWNTSQVTDMSYMFYACNNLRELDLSTFDTSQVTDTINMFYTCRKLATLDLSSWDLSKTTSTSGMFSYCSSLRIIKLNDCSNGTIEKIITSAGFPVDNSGTIYCKKTESIDKGLEAPGNWKFSFVDIPEEPEEPEEPEVPEEPENIPLYNLGQFMDGEEFIEVTTMVNKSHDNLSYMFYGCVNLVSVNTEDWDTSNVTNMEYMFNHCELLPELSIGNWDTSNVTNMYSMFSGCYKLTELYLSNWDLSSIKSSLDGGLKNMFNGCSSLQSLDLSSWDLSHLDYSAFSYMFNGCNSLCELHLDNCNNDTIYYITSYLPRIDIGKSRTIYCKKSESEDKGLTAPSPWVFSFVPED